MFSISYTGFEGLNLTSDDDQMDYEKLKKMVDDYFEKTSPEEVVKRLEELGCELVDIESE